MSNPRLCLALDGPAAEAPVAWVERTRSVFGVYKVGLELFYARGPGIIDACRRAGARQIFLDLKLHDIPRTVSKAIGALRPVAADYLTVHLAGGRAMLDAAQAAAGETRLLGVTVLTSLGDDDMHAVGLTGVQQAVSARARLARDAGLAGVVCSPLEAANVKALGLAPVTPGIRWADARADDQRRVCDPAAALTAGAALLVIGRLITGSADLPTDLKRLEAACH